MEKDILRQVIEVEKEIQKCLESEKVKIREWLEGVKKESDEEFLREELEIKQSLDQSLREATRQSETAAAEILSEAADAAERLKRLKAETLTGIIGRRIAGILPG